MSVHKDGDLAYVWVEGLKTFQAAYRTATFFTVFSSRGQAAVSVASSYNVEEMRGSERFEKDREKVFRSEAETVSLNLPKDCTPKEVQKTPIENEMIAVIDRTIRNELRTFNKLAGTNYPSELRVIIADFEWNYPRTFVLLPTTGEIFSVALHDARNPLDDRFLKQGEYPIQPIAPAPGRVQKIEKHGIVREIRLDG